MGFSSIVSQPCEGSLFQCSPVEKTDFEVSLRRGVETGMRVFLSWRYLFAAALKGHQKELANYPASLPGEERQSQPRRAVVRFKELPAQAGTK